MKEVMGERTKELLFEVIQLLRSEIKPRFYDWKDADDWLFSQLSITKSEASEIFDERGELIYLGSTKDEINSLIPSYGETLEDRYLPYMGD